MSRWSFCTLRPPSGSSGLRMSTPGCNHPNALTSSARTKPRTGMPRATAARCCLFPVFAARLQSAGDHQQSGRDAGKDLPCAHRQEWRKAFACGSGPTSNYERTLTNQNEQLTCVAHVTGFGQPVYNWKINSTRVPSPDSGLISVNATVLVDDPNNPEHPTSSTQSVALYFESAFSQDYNGKLRNARDFERNLSGPHLANH